MRNASRPISAPWCALPGAQGSRRAHRPVRRPAITRGRSVDRGVGFVGLRWSRLNAQPSAHAGPAGSRARLCGRAQHGCLRGVFRCDPSAESCHDETLPSSRSRRLVRLQGPGCRRCLRWSAGGRRGPNESRLEAALPRGSRPASCPAPGGQLHRTRLTHPLPSGCTTTFAPRAQRACSRRLLIAAELASPRRVRVGAPTRSRARDPRATTPRPESPSARAGIRPRGAARRFLLAVAVRPRGR